MIRPSKFVNLAQDLVEASSALLRNRTINIMDMEGIIIASTERKRIGTFHSGAKRLPKPARISQLQSRMYTSMSALKKATTCR